MPERKTKHFDNAAIAAKEFQKLANEGKHPFISFDSDGVTISYVAEEEIKKTDTPLTPVV